MIPKQVSDMKDHLGMEGLCFALFNDGFMLVGDDGESIALQASRPHILIEIWYDNHDTVTKIECSAEDKKKSLPLTLSELTLFIISARTKRPLSIISN